MVMQHEWTKRTYCLEIFQLHCICMVGEIEFIVSVMGRKSVQIILRIKCIYRAYETELKD